MSFVSGTITPISPSEEYYDLGAYWRPITSANEAAQIWFNRGLNWCYAFNHAEALNCFEQALVHDPSCPMAYWGIAYAAGPNYNKAWRLFDPVDLDHTMKISHDAVLKAEDLSTNATPIERGLIKAIKARFPVNHRIQDYAPVDKAYAESMKGLYEKYSTDLDVLTLYVDARMLTYQRKMFDVKTGRPIDTSPVYEVQSLFDAGFKLPGGLQHPGLIHFSIHFWEMSDTPARALTAANRLRTLVPDGGHLNHMPTHLDILLGDYCRSVDSNQAATDADEKYLSRAGAKNMYSFYRLHNYHSLIYAAMLSGRKQVSLDAVEKMEASITDDVLQVQSPPLADWLEFFKGVRIHVYIRFGLWKELKALPLPHDQQLYCVTTAVTHYGKGIAWAATANIAEAEKERELYLAAIKRVPITRKDYPNPIAEIFKVSTAMLNGELEYRKGNFDRSFEYLREAIKHDDGLIHSEPWGWMLPTRHAYAALSLEQGLVEQAALAYAEDLGFDEAITRAHHHPNNVWALHGFYECLKKLGRDAEARIIKPQLDVALGIADIEIKSSCFCRMGPLNGSTPESKCC
ncbi:hypothetical protein PHISCL_03151 [Aspergillus sclerotialis]|uniref:TPR domain protein n=1 Tax=Aspergillus sclerotialis TaxID=2070753 RepID=A0A3A2ZQD7_9EURO|nr:hypothetical protein PHISCL_03151 [Aspergillus sclerotialis]